MDTLFLNEQRCACGKLLLKGIFFDGTLEIKCKKCGAVNKIGNIKLADDSTHYLLIINNKGIIVNVSSSACKILGYSHEELVGQHFSKINPTLPKEMNEKLLGLNSALTEDNYFQLKTFHQTKSGNKIPVVDILRLYHPAGKEKFILASVELINTENKKIDKDEIKYLNNACDLFIDIDVNGTIEYVSTSPEEFIGLSSDDVIGKNYFDCIPNEVRDERKKIFDYFSDKQQPYRLKCDNIKYSNAKITCSEIYFTPNYNDRGKFVGYRILVWAKK